MGGGVVHIVLYINVLCEGFRPLVFSAAKNVFKSVISICCCSVSVGNIS